MRNFMTDRDLIKKLSNLREIKPDSSWLKANRDSLYSQISNSGATNLSPWTAFVINFKSLVKTASSPAVALASLLLVVFASSSYAHLLLSKTRPDQSLYIAREISEKAKLSTILDTNEREKMAVKFAANNAQDITSVLADPEFNNEEEIAKLNVRFNQEIETVQRKVAKLEQPLVQKNDTSEPSSTSSDLILSATLEKEDSGLSINDVTTAVEPSVSSTTKILEEAKNLFDSKNYTEALNKLKEVNDLIK